MSKESVIFGVVGLFFGTLVGWIVGAQQVAPAPAPAGAAQTAPASPQSAQPASSPSPNRPARPLDEARVARLKEAITGNAKDSRSRVELANLYFDAERFKDAAQWYEDALTIDPRNVNANTDLGIAYYYMDQPDRAIGHFDRSLAIDPKHSKTLLNLGFVRAFAKEDLPGATQAWQRVIDVAPDTPEARAARQAIDAVRSSHPGVGAKPGSGADKAPGTSD